MKLLITKRKLVSSDKENQLKASFKSLQDPQQDIYRMIDSVHTDTPLKQLHLVNKIRSFHAKNYRRTQHTEFTPKKQNDLANYFIPEHCQTDSNFTKLKREVQHLNKENSNQPFFRKSDSIVSPLVSLYARRSQFKPIKNVQLKINSFGKGCDTNKRSKSQSNKLFGNRYNTPKKFFGGRQNARSQSQPKRQKQQNKTSMKIQLIAPFQSYFHSRRNKQQMSCSLKLGSGEGEGSIRELTQFTLQDFE